MVISFMETNNVPTKYQTANEFLSHDVDRELISVRRVWTSSSQPA